MESSMPWQVSGVGREARQTAREAARRAGMSIGEWLDSIIMESAETVEAGQPGGREHGRYDHDPAAFSDETPPLRSWQAEHDDLGLRAAERREPPLEPELPDRTVVAHDHDSAAGGYLSHEVTHPQPEQPSRPRVRHVEYDDRLEYEDRPDLRYARRDDNSFERYRPHLSRQTDEHEALEQEPPHPVRPSGAHMGLERDPTPRARPTNEGEGLDHEAPHHFRGPEQPIMTCGLKEARRAETASLTGELGERPAPADAEDRSENQLAFEELNRRLDVLTGQLGKVAAGATQAGRPDPGNAETSQQLIEIISKLDSRLDRLITEGRSTRTDIEQRVNAVSRAVADLSRERMHPIASAESRTPLDQALIEIADRQRVLDGYAARSEATLARAMAAPQGLPRAPTQELSGLEQQLRQINAHIETLKPCGVDRAIDSLRDDLAQIGVMLQDALPRKSVEAIEHEMRSLAERIDRSRNAGADEAALASVERGLAEVRDALRGLAPAENLAGVDHELQQLSQKIDGLANHSQDPAALQQLEEAIAGVRGIVSNIASNDALASLSDEIRTLAGKVDRAASGTGSDNVLNALEERIAALAEALAARSQVGQDMPRELETVIKGLADKIERVQLTGADHAALGHLEDRIAKLVEKLDASDARLNHLEGIERALAELLIYLEQQRVPPARAESLPPEMNELSRDVADLRLTGRQTQESLEVVHGTLGHLVDRLAMIETDMRSQLARHGESSSDDRTVANSIAAAMLRPAASPRSTTTGAIAGTGDSNAAGTLVKPTASHEPPPPRLDHASQHVQSALTESSRLDEPSDVGRRTIDPSFPPDHPLEPGSGGSRRGPPGSPADRIAASEAALIGATTAIASDPGGKSNFIAAARRAAQAASREPPAKTAASASRAGGLFAGKPAGLGGRTRVLIIAGSAIVILIGGLQIARNFLSSPQEVQTPAPEVQHPAADAVTPENPVDLANPDATGAKEGTPSAREPAPAPPAPPEPTKSRQSLVLPFGGGTLPVPPGAVTARDSARQTTSTPPAASGDDNGGEREVTGSITPDAGAVTTAPAKPPALAAHAPPIPLPASTPAQVPAQTSSLSPSGTDKLPATLSGSLRAAAGRGEAAAQYEIAKRFAEGQGLPQNLTEAAQWFERAAKQGLIPAQFRLGGLYEKGLGVKKNLDTARQYYVAAGEAGHAKALHNLAVIYAEGIEGKPDYATAARWFRKAADYGVADSQYNLAILYARGIGVEQNLTEAYKWFALAAKDGDAESARKRDELGALLDRNTLTIATAAVQAWTPQRQPEAAVNVKTPPGGWDQAVSSVSVPIKQKPPVVSTPKLDLATPRHDQ
jgi:localization factor PodJL